MKRMYGKIILSVAAIALSGICASGKTPPGKIFYNLPSTTVVIEAEAVCENFHAGPYAEFARKYLGIDARIEDSRSYVVKSLRMTPFVEADPSAAHVLDVGQYSIASPDLLKLTSQGLVSIPGDFSGRSEIWRFPSYMDSGRFDGTGAGSNFSSETVELYTLSENDGVYERISVRQNQVVAKSVEQKAAETASAIFRLREKREQIITGDTDATFDGEALGAAVAEITRLEEQYMTLFLGYTDYSVQKMNFDFTPLPDEQVYVVFRISDENGLVPADDMSGRPVLAVLKNVERLSQAEVTETAEKGKQVEPLIYYRVPAVAEVAVSDGTKLLSCSRVQFYQLGTTLSMPVRLEKR